MPIACVHCAKAKAKCDKKVSLALRSVPVRIEVWLGNFAGGEWFGILGTLLHGSLYVERPWLIEGSNRSHVHAVLANRSSVTLEQPDVLHTTRTVGMAWLDRIPNAP